MMACKKKHEEEAERGALTCKKTALHTASFQPVLSNKPLDSLLGQGHTIQHRMSECKNLRELTEKVCLVMRHVANTLHSDAKANGATVRLKVSR